MIIPTVGEDVEQLGLSTSTPTLENKLAVSYKFTLMLNIIPLLGIYLRKMKTYSSFSVYTETYTQMFTVALFIKNNN